MCFLMSNRNVAALQQAANMPEQQNKEERLQLIERCRSCIVCSLKQWECHSKASNGKEEMLSEMVYWDDATC
jgi:hypothetical protein